MLSFLQSVFFVVDSVHQIPFTPSECTATGVSLEEFPVRPNMATFVNTESGRKSANLHRVIYTSPDATGITTFCGVVSGVPLTTYIAAYNFIDIPYWCR